MNDDYQVGDYIDVKGEAIIITKVADGMLFNNNSIITAHGNIPLTDDVIMACGFEKTDDEWIIEIKNVARLICKKGTLGRYSIRIVNYAAIGNK